MLPFTYLKLKWYPRYRENSLLLCNYCYEQAIRLCFVYFIQTGQTEVFRRDYEIKKVSEHPNNAKDGYINNYHLQ